MMLILVQGTAQASEAGPIRELPMGQASSADPKQQPRIEFRKDGADLIASIQVTANNSPHALWTSFQIIDKEVTLRYCLVQNRDRLVRSQKKVAIEWRLENFAILPAPPLTYRVEGFSMTPNTKELKGLMPQLQALVADKAGRSSTRIEAAVEAEVIEISRREGNDKLGECLVKVVQGNGLLDAGKARVLITAATRVEKLEKGLRLAARFEDLKPGDRIRFSGFRHVMESYPVQVQPTDILIVHSGSEDLGPWKAE
jgi:hypothetical protein